ncbi:MAG: ABC transporter ATP-binding protein [Pseudobdellovibrionaceae bacterium]|uniref:ABC transporter ATP-binding protein n=1 Tax=Oligoflexus sp. TaxID=1971216 RepID=UPI0027C89690|nr:ABC transporter ATP-binding protein [Oligoflexus sp.]MDQ3235414.1 ABC transporter ATP-binding protein [Pseudobdellovibrionaceae bacterium]HYX32319.1 ABC transporter ATP-binding protein [Oligoflexus sp.]
MTQAIRIESVSKVYPLGKTEVRALKNINLNIEEGEFTTIAGPSGCGKSTLLNLIGCMDTPTSGEVYIENQPISKLSDKDLTRLRLEKLGFIFQSFNLIPVLTVYQNIEFPLLIHGGFTPKDRARIIDELVEEVGLKDQAKQKSNELSGGQRQRVAIARALVTSPRIVLADEPTANLDSATGEKIINLMKEINSTHKTTFIFSTHDPQVMQHASRVVRLKDGEVVKS